MKRRKARERIVQFLYQVQIQTDDLELQQKYFNEEFTKNSFEEEEIQYINRIICGVLEKQSFLDEKIKEHLIRWKMERLPKVDLSILRVAIYEIYFEKIPFSVAINEAVILAKKYSTEDSKVYINGLLAQLNPDQVVE